MQKWLSPPTQGGLSIPIPTWSWVPPVPCCQGPGIALALGKPMLKILWMSRVIDGTMRWPRDGAGGMLTIRQLPAESQDSDAALRLSRIIQTRLTPDNLRFALQAATEDRTAALVLGVLAVLAVGISVGAARRARSEVLRLPEH